MSQDDSMILGLEALQKASEGEKLDARAIEVGLIVEGEKFRRLSEEEVGRYLTRVPTAS
jgi:proteasome alpha subunit